MLRELHSSQEHEAGPRCTETITGHNGSVSWVLRFFFSRRRMRTYHPLPSWRYRHDVVSAGRDYNQARRAICSGFFRNAAKKDPQEGYKTLVEGTLVHIHPSSALFNRPPPWLIYNELILTTREYCHTVTTIEPKWLIEVAPQFFKVANANKISKRKRQEKIEPLYNKVKQIFYWINEYNADFYVQYEKPDEWRLSKVKRSARSVSLFQALQYFTCWSITESNLWMRWTCIACR